MTRARDFSELATVYDSGASIGFRNRIINGGMVLDQRNAGASVTPNNETQTYLTDRWFFVRSSSTSPTLQRSTDAPPGFTNSLLFTNASTGTTPTYAQVAQRIEGFNVADLGWGAAGAVTVTVSFWVKSSLTGTYSVALRNSASNRAYVSTYTISAANTWEQKTVTIAGDTTGTWLKDNGVGIELVYRFGGSGGTSSLNQWTATGDVYASGSVNVMGTANATWQITGVQLEAGTVASPFERRDYGRELAMCQRYYYLLASGISKAVSIGTQVTATLAEGAVTFPVEMRTTPSLVSTTGTDYYNFYRAGVSDTFNSFVLDGPSPQATFFYNNAQISGTAGQAGLIYTNNAAAYVAFQAEL